MKRLLIALFVLLAITAGAQTNISLPFSTQTQPASNVAGIVGNSNTRDYYQGQMDKNLVGNGWNIGFEPPINKEGYVQIVTGDRSSVYSINQYTTTPPGFWTGAKLTIINSQRSASNTGFTGTVTSSRPAYYSQRSDYTTYSVGDQVIAYAGPSRRWRATVAGTTGLNQPGTMTTAAIGATVTDGGVTWQCVGYENWTANTGFLLNAQIIANVTIGGVNAPAIIQATAVTGNTGSTQPSFATTFGGTKTDGGVTWTTLDWAYEKISVAANSIPVATSSGDVWKVEQYSTSISNNCWMSAGCSGINLFLNGGGVVSSNTTDVDPNGGLESLYLDTTAGGSSSAGAVFYFDTSDKDMYLLMNGTYQLSFDAKAITGTPSLSWSVQRGSTNGVSASGSIATTSTWGTKTATFAGAEVDTNSGNPNCVYQGTTSACTQTGVISLKIVNNAVGTKASIDNVSLVKTSSQDSANTTVFRDEVIHAYQYMAPGSSLTGVPCLFRGWGSWNNDELDNLLAPSFLRRPVSNGANSVYLNIGLDETLQASKVIGCEPYIMVPIWEKVTNAPNWIEYLAGGTGTTYGAKRAALGQTASYTSIFPMVHLTIGNENWNCGTFLGDCLGGRNDVPNNGNFMYDYEKVAGLYIGAMHGSSSYDPNKFQLILNAWTAAADDGRISDTSTLNANGPDGWEVASYRNLYVGNETPANYFLTELAQTYASATTNNDDLGVFRNSTKIRSLNTCGASRNKQCVVHMYEAGSGLLNSGTNGSCPTQQNLEIFSTGGFEGIMNGLSMQLYLQKWGMKFAPYTMFEFSNGGPNGCGGLSNAIQGIMVDARRDNAPGGTVNTNFKFHARPQFFGIRVTNQGLIGAQYQTTMTGTPTVNFAGNTITGQGGVPANAALPLVYSFSYKTGNTYSVVLYNADQNNSQPVTFSGAHPPSGTVTQYQFAPPSAAATNELSVTVDNTLYAPTMADTTTTLPSFNAASGISLPKASVTTLTWTEGTDPPPTGDLTPRYQSTILQNIFTQ